MVDLPYPTDIKLAVETEKFVRTGKATPVSLKVGYSSGDTVYMSHQKNKEIALSDFALFSSNGEFSELHFTPQIPLTEIPPTVSIVARYHYDSTLTAFLTVPLRYDGQYKLNFSGADGDPGAHGVYALPFSDRGHRGQDGADGEHGGVVKAYVTAVTINNQKLLRARFISYTKDEYVVIDPKQGKIQVTANGRNGGNSGRGGDGGEGKDGADETRHSAAQDGGPGGPGGHGGNGGNAGSLTIYCDSSAHMFLSTINFSAKAGEGGRGGNGGKGGHDGSQIYREDSEDTPENMFFTVLSLMSATGDLLSGFRGPSGADGEDGVSGEKATSPTIELVPYSQLEAFLPPIENSLLVSFNQWSEKKRNEYEHFKPE